MGANLNGSLMAGNLLWTKVAWDWPDEIIHTKSVQAGAWPLQSLGHWNLCGGKYGHPTKEKTMTGQVVIILMWHATPWAGKLL